MSFIAPLLLSKELMLEVCLCLRHEQLERRSWTYGISLARAAASHSLHRDPLRSAGSSRFGEGGVVPTEDSAAQVSPSSAASFWQTALVPFHAGSRTVSGLQRAEYVRLRKNPLKLPTW